MIGVVSVENISGDVAGRAIPDIVNKTWGYELHYRNDDKYCMKWLHFQGPLQKTPDNSTEVTPVANCSTSMHFHVKKHETLLVVNGILTLEVIINKVPQVHRLNPGDAWVICPGHVHRLCAYDGPLDLIEASTKDYNDDSIRIG